MASLDMTAFDAGLKALYAGQKIQDSTYKKNPFHALLPKMERMQGKNYPLPIKYSNPMGRSATFSTAQSNAVGSKLDDFVLTRNHDYGVATIDNETMEASSNDAGAFMDAATFEIDGMIDQVAKSLATAEFRDGSGVIGVINSTVTGTTLTLATAGDIVNFEVGMKIQFSSAGTSATLRDSGEALTVTAVNRSAGSMTVSANLNTITGLTAADKINVEGDIEGKIKGLEAWLPSSVTSTPFFGVDRTLDSVRLGGNYLDKSSSPIEEALIDGITEASLNGGSPDYCFMSYANWANLEKALGSKVQYVDVQATPSIGFRGISLASPEGMVKVVADRNCNATDAFILDMSTWKLCSIGKAPKLLELDGNKVLRQASADGVEVRVGYYAQLGCVAPGYNARVKISS